MDKMFKLESYITPVLLNYVGKYVKNFKPEQSQVSLWGGDGIFQNLDLRLDVLNEQFDFPFTFVSGHIHELLIHVPWVKITSEPIVITINTIECILKMKDGSEERDDLSGQLRSAESLQEYAPSGYMKSIVTRVVNNITINCNNLILKFVEEDIVLSVNIRFLSMQTVDDEWKPTFTDVNNGLEMILRRVVTIEDLTLCLDRMDSSGKIDVYQDPMVYRCSMTIRLLMNYQNNQSKRATITRFDMHCTKMDFSMTEQQIPMLLRLVTIIMSRQPKRVSIDRVKSSSMEEDEELDDTDSRISSIAPINNLGWSTWAWNAMTSVLPVDWSEDWSTDQNLTDVAHTFHSGIYIENAVLTFKTVETYKEQFSHKSMKVRYRPFLTLRLFGLVASAIQQDITTTAYQFGLGAIQLFPRGNCSCGFAEVITSDPPLYLSGGSSENSYLNESLFDPNAPENQTKVRDYKEEINQRLMSDNPAKEFLRGCPALSYDFVHIVEFPDDITDIQLFELGSNYQFSNFKEHAVTRYFIGDLKIRICSGIIHRLTAIMTATEESDFRSCIPRKNEPKVDELPPVTIEEFEALNDYVPTTETTLGIFKLVIQFQLADHLYDNRKIRNNEKKRLLKSKLLDYPRLNLEFDEISGKICAPMYGFRLVACASKQNELPEEMLNQCYKKIIGNVIGFNSRLLLTENLHTPLIMPSNFDFFVKTLIYPQYWMNPDLYRRSDDFRMDCLSITTTKTKLMVSHSIIMSIFYPDMFGNPLICSSLLNDALNEANPVYLEFSIENVNYSGKNFLGLVSKKLNVGAVKVFALNNDSQAFVFSGPEDELQRREIDSENSELLNVNLHMPINLKDPGEFIFTFRISQTRLSADPLLLAWLNYHATFYEVDTFTTRLENHEGNSSDTSSKRTFPSLHENVHSPSDKERKWHWMRELAKKGEIEKNTAVNSDSGIFQRIKKTYPRWRKMILNGTIESFIIYLPTKTMDGVDMNGIEESKDRASAKDNTLGILAIKTSFLNITSTDFPSGNENSCSFPWTLNLSKFHCYTTCGDVDLNLLRTESLEAAIDIVVKPNVTSHAENSSSSTLGLCIHIDTSPIIVSCSKDQLKLIKVVLLKSLQIIRENFGRSKNNMRQEVTHPLLLNPPSSLKYLGTNSTSSASTTSASKDEVKDATSDEVVMTAWIQWTLPKFIIKLYSFDSKKNVERKTVIAMEDIITSLDWQPIYIQMKNKVMTANAHHFFRSKYANWQVGEYCGLIMFLSEVLTEYDYFLNITITIAKSNSVYPKWDKCTGRFSFQRDCYDYRSDGSGWIYITEIAILLHGMDIILPTEIIEQYFGILTALVVNEGQETDEGSHSETEDPPAPSQIFSSGNLPLIRFTFDGLKLVLPITSENKDLHNDTIFIEMNLVDINPHAVNPICRTVHQPDIHELAAQSNLLYTPGSCVEDRQYVIQLNGVKIKARNWEANEDGLKERYTQSSLHTMNENPALEWNTKDNSSNVFTENSLYIMSSNNFSIIVAPPIIYKSDTIICGSAIEVTSRSDIKVELALDNFRLISELEKQFINLINQNWSTSGKTKNVERKPRPVISPTKIFIENSSECLRDGGRDSGVDVEISSTVTSHLPSPDQNPTSTFPLCEYFLNCGKISVNLYQEVLDDSPLIRITVDQPHAYISQQNLVRLYQVNCFDFSIAFIDALAPGGKPLDYYLLETKTGDLHPITGIPPSFLVAKFEKSPKNCRMNIDLGRPIKIKQSSSMLEILDVIRKKIVNCLNREYSSNETKTATDISGAQFSNEDKLQRTMVNFPDLNITTKQIVFEFVTDVPSKLIMSISELSANLSFKSRKIISSTSIKSAIIATSMKDNSTKDIKTRALLKPSSCRIVTSFIWEPWQDTSCVAQSRIQAYSEDIRFEIGPDHFKVLQDVHNEVENIFKKFSVLKENENMHTEKEKPIPATEQHYQDDLKVGAFQFIDGSGDELPLPYQVVFSSDKNQTIAWRYPQPRILTRLHITPAFFDIIDEFKTDFQDIHCVIEFWSESLLSYQRFIELNLLETDKPTFQLPNKSQTRAVACIWRLVLCMNEKIDARTLAGCLRIDSYFNSSSVPNMEVILSLKSIELAFFNHLDTSIYRNLPPPLKNYNLNSLPPSSQCFSLVNLGSVIFVVNKWRNLVLIDVKGSMNVGVLDYADCRMRSLLEKFDGKFQISMADHINIVMMCDDVFFKFGPEICHTLTSSFNIWSSALGNRQKNIIILSRVVVANDSNIPITFRQSQSTNRILLQSRQCNFYSWGNTNLRKIGISIENEDPLTQISGTIIDGDDGKKEIWSQEFDVKEDGCHSICFDEKPNCAINVNIKSISAVQKLITFSGQLIICNQLMDNILLQLIEYQPGEKKENKKILSERIFSITSNSRPPSIFIGGKENLTMRLHLSTGSQWTGDIPLHQNAKCDQPWLVKVPKRDRHKFLSIWVRIIRENNKLGRILVVLSPLYMVKSYLPMDIEIQVGTPSMSTTFDTQIQGHGKIHQLNCPGTFENTHQITFHPSSKISSSTSCIPLSYDSVDLRTFFKRPDEENIEKILADLDTRGIESFWPFRDDDSNLWKPVKELGTHVLVKYRDAGFASSTLILEMRPWCFFANSTGLLISILSDGNEICRIPHHHVASPPKLEGIFHIEIEIDGSKFRSSPLQLASSEWNRGFMMPQISGLIPVDGSVKIVIDCEEIFCALMLTSSIEEEMRVVKVSSSHVVCNFSKQTFHLSAISARSSSIGIDLPNDFSNFGQKLEPNGSKNEGKPVPNWINLDKGRTQGSEMRFVILSTGHGWSCPVNVDQLISRTCISIPNGPDSIPIVVTTQKDKDIAYIIIFEDEHPQLLVKNFCPFDIQIGTINATSDGIRPDSPPFSWICEVQSKKTCYYTAPCMGSRIPDASIVKEAKTTLFLTTKQRNWNKIIEISTGKLIRFIQFVQVDSGTDLKIIVESQGHTVTMNIEPKSKIELSAKHIRARLISDGAVDSRDQRRRKSSICECPSNSNEEIQNYRELETISKAAERYADEKNVEKDKVFTLYFHGITVIITQDTPDTNRRQEVACLYLTKTVLSLTMAERFLNIAMMTTDLQLDNQMFDQGGFDFPVVLISQKPLSKTIPSTSAPFSLENTINDLKKNSLMTFECFWEKVNGKRNCESVYLRFSPINIYIEDKYVTQLLEYTTAMMRPCLMMNLIENETIESSMENIQQLETDFQGTVQTTSIPENIIIDARIMSSPLLLRSLIIEPISLLLSVHTSVRLYVALDHSPLHFGIYERHNLFTTPYRLGNALTMHYLSGAIFGAGWMVGSLEILGSPGSFAQALGSGLKDFIAFPFQGLLQGPWGFIVGITHGSASLMKNITAGTVNSVTKLASSVARNLDRLTLDAEHLQRQEESRRIRPEGLVQGLHQGLTGFGICILAAIAGIAHHPLQNFMSGQATTAGLVTGVGLGLVGVVTKPLSGAAELVALTGQGLLRRTGWNSLPAARRPSKSLEKTLNFDEPEKIENCYYLTKFYPNLGSTLLEKNMKILHVSFGDFIDREKNKLPVTVILTRKHLFVINMETDNIRGIFEIRDLDFGEQIDDESFLTFGCPADGNERYRPYPSNEVGVGVLDMNVEIWNRTEQYVISCTRFVNLTGDNTEAQTGSVVRDSFSSSSKYLYTFYFEPREKNYLLALARIMKKQNQRVDFKVL